VVCLEKIKRSFRHGEGGGTTSCSRLEKNSSLRENRQMDRGISTAQGQEKEKKQQRYAGEEKGENLLYFCRKRGEKKTVPKLIQAARGRGFTIIFYHNYPARGKIQKGGGGNNTEQGQKGKRRGKNCADANSRRLPMHSESVLGKKGRPSGHLKEGKIPCILSDHCPKGRRCWADSSTFSRKKKKKGGVE